MDSSEIKKIFFCLIVVSLVVIVLFARNKDEAAGIDSIEQGEMVWVKCMNTKCSASYQTNLKEYLKSTHSPGNPVMGMGKCNDCGQASLIIAKKCPKCNAVFKEGSACGGYPDKCPECGYSERENRVKH